MRMRRMSFGDSLARETAAPRRWLSIVGIGEDGIEGLTPIARSLVRAAEMVFGGQRHLVLAAPLLRRVARPWRSPLRPPVEGGVAQPVRARGRGGVGAARTASMRARIGRSIRLRRRLGLAAACRPPRDDDGAGAFDLQPCRRTSGLGAAGDDPALAAWPCARSRPS